MHRFLWIPLSVFVTLSIASGGETADLSLRVGTVVIPQIDYEPLLTPSPEDGMPWLNLRQVDFTRVVDKEHVAIRLESAYLRVVLLPEMGRVYSMHYKPTDHETLWRNDIVRPGGANNRLGWWLWIGGIEYTLPGEEHGYTWALPWEWEVLEDGDERVAVRVQVTEPTTGLRHRLEFGLAAGSAALETSVSIHNPTADTVEFAHWVNPMWAPGGRNELTDDTEYLIPADRILIAERWQKNLGPSPQQWATSALRQHRNWRDMGDLMVESLTAGFYGVYSHDADEGVVRVFDPLATPGLDVWSYGFHPDNIPTGSGKPNKGYAEMWGGTSLLFPDELRPLAPRGTKAWTEWIYPIHRTAGADLATRYLALSAHIEQASLTVRLCPAQSLEDAQLTAYVDGRRHHVQRFTATPAKPLKTTIAVPPDGCVTVIVHEHDMELARIVIPP